jgi:hypothetical protein
MPSTTVQPMVSTIGTVGLVRSVSRAFPVGGIAPPTPTTTPERVQATDSSLSFGSVS